MLGFVFFSGFKQHIEKLPVSHSEESLKKFKIFYSKAIRWHDNEKYLPDIKPPPSVLIVPFAHKYAETQSLNEHLKLLL